MKSFAKGYDKMVDNRSAIKQNYEIFAEIIILHDNCFVQGTGEFSLNKSFILFVL